MPMAKRRRLVLKSHKNSYLSSARSMLALSNVTRDKDTKEKSRQDAAYFFKKHKRSKKR